MRISSEIEKALRCPCCSSRLTSGEEFLQCARPECGTRFVVLGGVPVLLNETWGLFSIEDNFRRFSGRQSRYLRLKTFAKRIVPRITTNVAARRNYSQLAKMLLNSRENPRVLVIGAGGGGIGVNRLFKDGQIEVVETDVAISERTHVVCDAHQLPFANETFDAVIIQAVVEYLQEPGVCVGEIHRVLRTDGMVYSEAPFLQPVHGREHDFGRFTHVGHRRLYRQFEEISSGVCVGPAAALACEIQYFVLSIFSSKATRDVLKTAVRFGLFWLKYLDYLLIHNRGAIDAAGGTFFLGRKCPRVMLDREVIASYKGAVTADGIFLS